LGATLPVNAVLNQENGMIDSESGGCMIFPMKRQFFPGADTGLAASALILTSCSTTETRISDILEIFQSLSRAIRHS